ncbi:hypothetical protein SS05631_a46890 (plasmid) [Sinorhizobium sp. CCBAU 05631]|nr:hypothetical protein SS05631_a46890 [Sinorhizobium sp. CCBAU 05631]
MGRRGNPTTTPRPNENAEGRGGLSDTSETFGEIIDHHPHFIEEV